MKDLTVSMPIWYIERRNEYDKTIKRALERECFRILAYSKVVKKIVVAAYDNCGMRLRKNICRLMSVLMRMAT